MVQVGLADGGALVLLSHLSQLIPFAPPSFALLYEDPMALSAPSRGAAVDPLDFRGCDRSAGRLRCAFRSGLALQSPWVVVRNRRPSSNSRSARYCDGGRTFGELRSADEPKKSFERRGMPRLYPAHGLKAMTLEKAR